MSFEQCGIPALLAPFARGLGSHRDIARSHATVTALPHLCAWDSGLTGNANGGLAQSELDVDDPLSLRPDFWVNFIFKRTVGTDVLSVAATQKTNTTMVRSYAFSGTPPSPFAAKECVGTSSGRTFVLLNLMSEGEAEVRLPAGGAETFSAWILGPRGDKSDPLSQGIALNGNVLPQIVDLKGGAHADFLEEISVAPIKGTGSVTLPPTSIAFVCS